MKPLYPLLIFCFMSSLLLAQPEPAPSWATGRFFPVKKNQRWGVLQQDGKLCLPTQYKHIQFGLVHEGKSYPYFLVETADNKWGVLDTLGQEVLAAEYCAIELVQPKGPYFATRRDCEAPVELEVSQKRKRNSFLKRLSVKGEKIASYKAVPNVDSLLYKINTEGLVGLENLRQGSVLASRFDSMEVYPKKAYVLTMQRGAQGEKLYSLYSMQGEPLLPARFNDFMELPSGFIALRDTVDGLWYVHHIDGFELPQGYKTIERYSTGFKLFHAYRSPETQRQGYDFFIPHNRIIRRNLYYDSFPLFGPYMGYEKRGKFGVVDDIGKPMLPPSFTHLAHIGKGYLEASMQVLGRRRRGVLTVMGERIVPPKFISVHLVENRLFYARLENGGFMLYDEQGNCVSDDGPYTKMTKVEAGQYKLIKEGKKGYGLLFIYEDEILTEWYSHTKALNIARPGEGLTITPVQATPTPNPSPANTPAVRMDTIGQLRFVSHLLDAQTPLYAPWEIYEKNSDRLFPLREIKNLQFPSGEGHYLRYSLSFFDEAGNSFKQRDYLLDAARAKVITPPIFKQIAAAELEAQDRPFFMGRLAEEAGYALIDSTGGIIAKGIAKVEQKPHFIKAHRAAEDYSLFIDAQGAILLDSVLRLEAIEWDTLFEAQQVDKPFFSLVDSSLQLVLDSLRFLDRRGKYCLAQFEGQEYYSLLDEQLELLVEDVKSIHQEEGLVFLRIKEEEHRTLLDEQGQVLADSITEAWQQGEYYLVNHVGRKGLSLMNKKGRCFLSGIVSYEKGEQGALTVAFKQGADVRYGLLDAKGDWIIQPHYRDLSKLKDAWLIATIEGGLTGIIDTAASWVVEPTEDYILPFNKNIGIQGFMLRREPAEQDWRILKGDGSYLLGTSFEQLTAVHGKSLVAKQNGKWGMLWTDGTERLPFEYQGLLPYRAGFAPAKKAGAWGLLDEKGALVIDFGYADFGTHFGDYFPVEIEAGWGLLKTGGELILPCRFDSIRYHQNGWIQAARNKRWYLFDKDGARLTRKGFHRISEFNSLGMAQTQRQKKRGLINNQGVEILPPRYREMLYLDSSGFLLASKGRYWECWTAEGQRLSAASYQQVSAFNSWGLAKAHRPNGSIHLLSKTEGRIAPPLRAIEPFDAAGRAIAQRKHLWREATWGLLNAQGEWCIAPRYDSISRQGDWIQVARKGKKGLFYPSGDSLLALSYDEIVANCSSPSYRVRRGKQWGLLSAKGEWIAPPSFEAVSDFVYTDSVAKVKKEGKYFALQQDGALSDWEKRSYRIMQQKPATKVRRVQEKSARIKKQRALSFPFGETQLMQPFQIGEDTMQFNLSRHSSPMLKVRAFTDSLSLVSDKPLFQLLQKEEAYWRVSCSPKYREMALLGGGLVAVRKPYEREIVLKAGEQIPQGPFDFVAYEGGGVFRVEQGQRLGYWHRTKGWLWPLQK